MSQPQPIKIDYTNYRGERSLRTIYPENILWGRTEYHPVDQWLLEAFDVEKNATRTFAMKDIHGWDVQLPKGTVSKTTVLDGYYATGDYEAFCFDTHKGPKQHNEANSKAWEAWYRHSDPHVDPDACRIYPDVLLPIERSNGAPFGKWEVTVTFTPGIPDK